MRTATLSFPEMRVSSNMMTSSPIGNTTMQVLVDADACPVAVKEILFRAARRVEMCVTLVANQYLRTPPSRFIKALQVPHGFDAADNRIVELVQDGDLVITADIPLAAAALDKGAHVLDPRGTWFSSENIQERLTMREVMDQLRNSGVETAQHLTQQATAKHLRHSWTVSWHVVVTHHVELFHSREAERNVAAGLLAMLRR
ncbi:MAG: Protein YaiI [uncultured Paraburkholderia sp.]|nr:MAG: Protein YaiI [uncultured Paraburkholderia sp.]